MKTLVYLSRAFVEFGPFSSEEMKDFHSRGLLRDIDHLRLHGEDKWLPLKVWAASVEAATKAAAKPKAKAAAKAAKIDAAATPKPKPKVVKKAKKTD